MSSDVVVIHTDGGCRPNPGPGGWGAVLRHREHVREMYGGESGVTSNNRMELTAPIMALEALTRPVVVHLYTDSTYVRNGITKWVLGWERNGWLTAAKARVKNVDLWQRLQAACARHQVEWFWVKGRSVSATTSWQTSSRPGVCRKRSPQSTDRSSATPASEEAQYITGTELVVGGLIQKGS